jgi:hypothetical protein
MQYDSLTLKPVVIGMLFAGILYYNGNEKFKIGTKINFPFILPSLSLQQS